MVMLRLLLAMALAAAAWWAAAAEPRDAVAENTAKAVVVAVPLSLQPYFIPLDDGGLAYDTIRAAFAASGYRVQSLYVTSRTLNALLRDPSAADCIPMAPPELDHGWNRTAGLHPLHDFAITRPAQELDSIEDLGSGRVIAYSGAKHYLGEAFRAVVASNPGYREISNHRAQVRLLLQGSVDVIIADRLLVSWYLDYLEHEGEGHVELAFHDLFEPLALGFVCRQADIAAAYDAGLAKIVLSGQWAKINERYHAEERSGPLAPRSQGKAAATAEVRSQGAIP
ncbi:amino acid ABC transporter substrate-binding protein [Thiorhodococcus mannitoliphagus]|uniref:Amino acid ABC transporter substrate-binding protein n=1 Tax=Thiorhodococcus mannitoliphagus TaxID=329406 RepID=A0A6P1E1G9_9GAMM|nr:transporter substrate-binding domain-containing protein [Thiorhodococcus mannitoliphagus]NEX21575.1 amino acid ABC transporter substrate-binding protein [Thiorhodococcus mannitoliphagus]